MSDVKWENLTNLNLDDIENILAKLGRWVVPEDTSLTVQIRPGKFEKDEEQSWVRNYASGQGSIRRHWRRTKRMYSWRHVTLVMYVPSRNWWKNQMSPMEYMATGLKGLTTSISFLDDFLHYLKISGDFWFDEPNKSTLDLVEELKLEPPRLNGHLDTVAKKRLAKEESEQFHRKMYGNGGEMGGSSRTHQWYWRHKLSDAQRAYAREWTRRDKYREKLAKKGVELGSNELNETFPQYLRRLADELESTPARSGRVGWQDLPKFKK